ncbi:vitamin K epoxide reductase/DsbA family protein [Desulfobulbus propionicus]
MKTKPIPFPYPFYFWQIVAYALLGLSTSLYLAYTHYKNHTDINFSSFCAITQAINCDTVAQSSWSIFWGIPIAIWGVFFYTLFLLIIFPLQKQNERQVLNWSLVTLVAMSAACCSVALAALSHTRIHSWCVLCVGTYVINFSLAFSSWIIFRRFSHVDFWRAMSFACKQMVQTTPVKIGAPMLIMLFLTTRIALPPYWNMEPVAIESNVVTGVTNEGFPWIGARAPQIIIEEFTDYQCFQCRKVHFYLRQLINQHPDRIRLIHRHYPLDNEFNRIIAPNPFHVGSGRLALVAIVATRHNSFWTVNDAIYAAVQTKKQTIELDNFAQLMGISKEQLAQEMFTIKSLKHLQHDMVQGLQRGIIGTPSFVVDDKVYQNTLPSELIKKMLR